jgi:hypothetical protein
VSLALVGRFWQLALLAWAKAKKKEESSSDEEKNLFLYLSFSLAFRDWNGWQWHCCYR